MVDYETLDDEGESSSDEDVVVREIDNAISMERMVEFDDDEDDEQFEMYQVEEDDDQEDDDQREEEEEEEKGEDAETSDGSTSECEIEVLGSLEVSAIEQIQMATSKARLAQEEGEDEEQVLVEFVKFDKETVAFLSGGHRLLSHNKSTGDAKTRQQPNKRTRSLPPVRPEVATLSSVRRLNDTITVVSGVLEKKSSVDELTELIGGGERILRVRSDEGSSAHVTAKSFGNWIKSSEAQGFYVDDSIVGSRAGLLFEKSLGLAWQRKTGLRKHPKCPGEVRMVWAPPRGHCGDDDNNTHRDAATTYVILKGHLVASASYFTQGQEQTGAERRAQKRTVDFEVGEGDCVFLPKGWGPLSLRHANKKNDQCVLWIKSLWQEENAL